MLSVLLLSARLYSFISAVTLQRFLLCRKRSSGCKQLPSSKSGDWRMLEGHAVMSLIIRGPSIRMNGCIEEELDMSRLESLTLSYC